MANGREWKAKEVAELVRLHQRGWSALAIARHLDLPVLRVRDKLANMRRAGDRRIRRQRPRYTELEIARVLALRACGLQCKEIARKVGRPPNGIFLLMRRLHAEGRIDEAMLFRGPLGKVRPTVPVRRRWAA